MKNKFIILSLSMAFLLTGCSSSTSEKYTELSAQYEYYQESIKNIQKNMEVDAAQADDIFLTLVDCGISDTINYVFKNNDNTFTVWSSGEKYSVVLENCVVSSVFSDGFPESVLLYPKIADSENKDSQKNLSDNAKNENEPVTYDSLSQVQIDKLQQLYLDFDSSFSYTEASEYISNVGLPYSDIKYNGSRVFQIAFTDGCTDQKYKKESGPYIVINYEYAKNENGNNDDLEKYSFSSCQYFPDSYFSYAEYKELTCISRLGSILEEYNNLTKEEQLLHFFNNQQNQ